MARADVARDRPTTDPVDPWQLPPNVLDRLTPAARARLARIASPRTFGAGATIMTEGASTPFLGVVLEGRIGLRLVVPERGPQTVVTIEPGELVGWSAVVPPYRATAEAIALAATRVEAMPASDLRDLLGADPDLAAQLLPIVLGCLSDRLTSSWHQLLDLFGGWPSATIP